MFERFRAIIGPHSFGKRRLDLIDNPARNIVDEQRLHSDEEALFELARAEVREAMRAVLGRALKDVNPER